MSGWDVMAQRRYAHDADARRMAHIYMRTCDVSLKVVDRGESEVVQTGMERGLTEMAHSAASSRVQ